jgi:hypothetical protein
MSIVDCRWLDIRCLLILIPTIAISIGIIGNGEPIRILNLIASRHVVVGL